MAVASSKRSVNENTVSIYVVSALMIIILKEFVMLFTTILFKSYIPIYNGVR